jgi:hypothetical protein
MIATKKAIPRRTVLRGLGVTLALPLLDSMVPAFASAATKPTLRFGAVYVPNGVLMKNFTPEAEGTNFELSPILQPLAPFRNQISVFSGLDHAEARAWADEGVGDHARASTTFLTGLHARKSESVPQLLSKTGDVGTGMSLDQIIAKSYAQETQLPSLELGIDRELVGSCDNGYACSCDHTIAWRSATMPLRVENNPRMVFERLFGASGTTDATVRLALMKEDRSVLDWATEQIAGLQKQVGKRDNARLDEYLDAVRDIERRIQLAEKQRDRELPVVDQPAGIPPTFEAHAKLLFDLQTLAWQTDLTRVFTFMMACEISGKTYPEIGVPDSHHPLTHDIVNPEPAAKVTKINTYHMQMFAYFLEKLKATPDGDGTLLDHAAIVYGSGISNGNVHSHENLPLLVVGSAGGQLKGGRHHRSPTGTPASNLYATLLDKFGLPAEHFGDSTGRLQGLSGI